MLSPHIIEEEVGTAAEMLRISRRLQRVSKSGKKEEHVENLFTQAQYKTIPPLAIRHVLAAPPARLLFALVKQKKPINAAARVLLDYQQRAQGGNKLKYTQGLCPCRVQGGSRKTLRVALTVQIVSHTVRLL